VPPEITGDVKKVSRQGFNTLDILNDRSPEEVHL